MTNGRNFLKSLKKWWKREVDRRLAGFDHKKKEKKKNKFGGCHPNNNKDSIEGGKPRKLTNENENC